MHPGWRRTLFGGTIAALIKLEMGREDAVSAAHRGQMTRGETGPSAQRRNSRADPWGPRQATMDDYLVSSQPSGGRLSQAARKEKEREERTREEPALDGRMHPQRAAQLERDEGGTPVRDEGVSRSASPARITARERSRVQVAVHRADSGILGEYDARQRELAEEEQLHPVTVTRLLRRGLSQTQKKWGCVRRVLLQQQTRQTSGSLRIICSY
ncbi:hypothetical protein B0H14DRAFT_2555692 [Mycena olivaceomarginata]|nr:hypothetical protein B0H14DRAFT_2555692 [Mycena olivaceomarginata]